MKLFIEGVKYSKKQLDLFFDDSKFYLLDGKDGIINSVGYFHSFENNEIIYLLPKVFLNNGLVFGKYTPIELLSKDFINTFKHSNRNTWIRQLIVYFYNSLSEFKKRNEFSELIENNKTLELNSNIGLSEYSFLDLLLSFVNFYKKNKVQILYKHIEHISNQIKKPKWERTIRKSAPLLVNEIPIYTEIRNSKKIKNQEEELLIFFYSILNHLNTEHSLGIKIDNSFNLIRGRKFEYLASNGLSKLRKIKYRYFSDTLIRMYRLVELYFSQTDTASPRRKRDEFIVVKNYNIVFEDMIDKLFSDDLNSNTRTNNYSLNDLKNNKDGKIIDHIYEDKSLIDTSNIFYIGDSKYYKPGHIAGNISIFKQFTYSKNIIQFNVDIFNQTNNYYSNKVIYRDEVTEGYNITPNFFIYGYVEDFKDFSNPQVERYQNPKKSFHFNNRLFDRDTLFIQQYRINFLFVLKSYSMNNLLVIKSFRNNTRTQFREHFLEFFNTSKLCEFSFYSKKLAKPEAVKLVDNNFKRLNGKCYYSIQNELIISVKYEDFSLNDIIEEFKPYQLS